MDPWVDEWMDRWMEQLHVRDGSGSGGIVSQMKASIESKAKAKAAAGSPSRPAAPNSTKQKINVRREDKTKDKGRQTDTRQPHCNSNSV